MTLADQVELGSLPPTASQSPPLNSTPAAEVRDAAAAERALEKDGGGDGEVEERGLGSVPGGGGGGELEGWTHESRGSGLPCSASLASSACAPSASASL